MNRFKTKFTLVRKINIQAIFQKEILGAIAGIFIMMTAKAKIAIFHINCLVGIFAIYGKVLIKRSAGNFFKKFTQLLKKILGKIIVFTVTYRIPLIRSITIIAIHSIFIFRSIHRNY